MGEVKIFDTTLRDGEQSPGVSLIPEEKLAIAKQLARMKVDVIEAGFPISSPGDFEAVQIISENIRDVEVAALARSRKKDIDRAWEALRNGGDPRIHVFIATSPIHMKYKLKLSEEQVIEKAVEAVKYASKYTSNIEFSAEDASRSQPVFLYRLFERVINAGAKVINIPDTVGYAIPEEFGKLIRDIKENVSNIDKVDISVHCHNDLGLAVANSLAAVENGANQIEVAVNGIGERAGNTALEEIIMALYTRKDFYNIGINQDTTQIARLSKLVSNLTGMTIQPNKAIVGANAFAHESGIHQDGVIKERTTYEIMDARTIGLKDNKLVLGKHSGRHAFREFIQKLGYDIDDETFEEIFIEFKKLADKKKNITHVEIEALIDNHYHTFDKVYELDYLSVNTGNKVLPTATIKLKKENNIIEKAACSGDGPVDAIFQAINEIVGIDDIKLISYHINAVTEGKDALGEVIVKTKIEDNTYTGHSAMTDITEASALAYLETINKFLTSEQTRQTTSAQEGI
ncbi:2-isopropylmalate synthase [Halothermothrix orenii]|uniref:2-isopropylmalate synthase n=1 Tax=Halothermothrix orenii (strain H 168 / OCM 544 / DSM 9562) TaxID=373903 RepID=LEU1_HALOH|nr:2-isopropylmalate synthase [Halothermothrix orenii]B8CX21.1 RecName: Full=2-isopropylmalate synthase; AltName: Full=Alpha-IPM synthase; AltName: Full=Alpha-isopropylmalate synthase [Halothermothrix orenii H 168]ACL69840.1 2-isopropylmalate synthase [Halothermothrix orenii H 168]